MHRALRVLEGQVHPYLLGGGAFAGPVLRTDTAFASALMFSDPSCSC